jgi:hypothetical protein
MIAWSRAVLCDFMLGLRSQNRQCGAGFLPSASWHGQRSCLLAGKRSREAYTLSCSMLVQHMFKCRHPCNGSVRPFCVFRFVRCTFVPVGSCSMTVLYVNSTVHAAVTTAFSAYKLRQRMKEGPLFPEETGSVLSLAPQSSSCTSASGAAESAEPAELVSADDALPKPSQLTCADALSFSLACACCCCMTLVPSVARLCRWLALGVHGSRSDHLYVCAYAQIF